MAETESKGVDCSICSRPMEISTNAKGGTCAHCVQKMVAPPHYATKKTTTDEEPKAPKPEKIPVMVKKIIDGKEVMVKRGRGRPPKDPNAPKKVYVPTGRPQGWHKKAKFVDANGDIYHRGKLVKKGK